MKFKACCIVFLMAVSAFADNLLVTTKGQGLRISSHETKGTSLVCTTPSGETHTIPKASVYTLIPLVTPGEEYSEAQIDEIVSKIKKTNSKFKNMFRQLNVIRNDWLAYKKNMGARIQTDIRPIVRIFMRDQTPENYSKAMMDIGMLKFKHKGEADSIEAIDDAVKGMQAVFYGVSFDEFQQKASNTEMGLADFMAMKEIARKAAAHGTPDERDEFNKLLGPARTALIEKHLPYARALFAKNRTLDNYMKGLSVLVVLKHYVAYTKEEKEKVNAEYDIFKPAAQKNLTKVDFSYKGFPITEADSSLFDKYEASASNYEHAYIDAKNEWVFVIPSSSPVVKGGMQGTLTASLNFIFNFLPVSETEYGLMFACKRYRKIYKHYIPLPKLRVSGGHAQVQIRQALDEIGSDILSLSDKDGDYVLLYVVQRDAGSDEEWQMISKGCRIPVVE